MSILNNIVFVRALRTRSSERFIVQEQGVPDVDLAAIDIHYLGSQSVSATLVILSDDYAETARIESLIETIDLHLLPMVSLNDGDLTFTVVRGNILGQYTKTET